MRTLLRGATILDGEHAPLRDHCVLVERERIAAVGPTAQFAGFAGNEIDLAGMTLLPGLIDCHVHLCFGAEADLTPLLAQLRPADFALRALANAQATCAAA
jgi:imidazolonepropionase-like amidohydrolase